MQEILDHEEKQENLLEGIEYRPLAMAVEGVPFFAAFVGYFLSDAIVVVSMCTLSMIYMVFSWYIFKGKKFTVGTVLFSIFNGLCLQVGVIGLLFTLMKWEGESAMAIVALFSLLLGMTISVIWYLVRKNKHFEFTLSLKLISRYVFYIVMIYATMSSFY